MDSYGIKDVSLSINFLLYHPSDVANLHLAICSCERELDCDKWSIKCGIAD